MVVQNVEHEAAAVRKRRRLRQQQQQQQQQRQGRQPRRPSREELQDIVQGSADPCLACDLGQQPWRVLACNAAAAALADLPEPLPQELPFCSLFELEQGPGAPGNANHQAATAQGQPFMLTCRLRPAEDRPSECSASGGAAGALGGQPHDAAAAAPRWVSGPDILLHSDPASSADGHAPVRAASGDAAGLQLPALREQQPGAAAADDLQAVDGGGTQAGPPWEPLVARGSLDSALPAVKHITAPDQVFSAAFAAYLPAELGGSTGEGVPTTGQPSIWLATLCPKNLAAMAAQARLGLLIGRHQLPQVQGGTAAAALGSLAASTTRLSSPDRAGRPRSTSVPRVLLPQSMQGVELGPLLGVGASGRTYAGRWQGSRVAVKCVELRVREPEALPDYAHGPSGSGAVNPGSAALVEAVLAKTLRHPHIVCTHAYGVRESGRHMGTSFEEVWIVQDLCTLGPLLRAIERGRFKQENSEPRLLFIVVTATEIAGALAYLHSKGVVHGDLSGNNVLLNPSTKDQRRFVAMVSDFGLARPMEVLTQLSTDTYGTISYMPPELVMNQKLSPAVDVYSFGVLLWELMSGSPAWAGMSSLQILAAVTSGRRLEVPNSWPPRMQSLIARCLDCDPRQRPSAKQVLQELEGMHAHMLAHSQPV